MTHKLQTRWMGWCRPSPEVNNYWMQRMSLAVSLEQINQLTVKAADIFTSPSVRAIVVGGVVLFIVLK